MFSDRDPRLIRQFSKGKSLPNLTRQSSSENSQSNLSKQSDSFSSRAHTPSSFEKNIFSNNPEFSSEVPTTSSLSSQCEFVKKSGSLLIMFLPNMVDERFNRIKQPLVVNVKESKLIEFGFDLPFKDYFDSFQNSFQITVDKFVLCGQIIASGADPISLHDSVKSNIINNKDWRNCNKMLTNLEFDCRIKHKPLKSSYDLPEQYLMEKNKFLDFLNTFKKLKRLDTLIEKDSDEKDVDDRRCSDDSSIEPKNSKRLKKTPVANSMTQEEGYKKSISSKKVEKNVSLDDGSCSCTGGKKSKEKAFDNLITLKDRLNERKLLLSQLDVKEMIISDLIEAISEIYNFLCESETESRKSIRKVPVNDDTCKDSKKKLIYIEGTIALDLERYKFASKNAKPSNPLSFAYNLIKNCFPKSYYQNVTLGKKIYSVDELESMDIERKDYKGKFVLPFIWGFKDPYEEPLQGKLHLDLGLARVQDFIDHCFRKSGIMEYNEIQEKELRNRIQKELCNMNALERNLKKNETEDQMSQDEEQIRTENEENDIIPPNLLTNRKTDKDKELRSFSVDIWDPETFDFSA